MKYKIVVSAPRKVRTKLACASFEKHSCLAAGSILSYSLATFCALSAISAHAVTPASNLKLTISGGIAVLQWTGTPGVLYQAEGVTNLGAAWQPIGAPTTDFAVSNRVTTPSFFYRVGIYCPSTVAASASPLTGGTVSSSGTVNCGSIVTVTASANINYSFANWTENGAIVSTTSNYSFTANGTRSLLANFVVASCTNAIMTSASPADGGTTSGSGTAACGSNVTVTATAASCCRFVSWTENGAVVSASRSYSFTASGNRNLQANFAQSTYNLTSSSSPPVAGSLTGSGVVSCGSNAIMTAAANSGYTFVNWTENGNIVSSSSTYMFVASANRTLIANFTNQVTLPPGQFQWAVSQAAGCAVAVDNNNNVVAGGYAPGTYGYCTLNKYSASGTSIWSKVFYSCSGNVRSVAVDATGNIYVTGTFLGQGNLGGNTFYGSVSSYSAFVAKFSPAGDHIWSRGFVSMLGDTRAYGIALDRSGNVVVTGSFFSADFGGGTMFSSPGAADMFVAKLSGSTGAYVWAKQFGTRNGGTTMGKAVAVDSSGNLFLTGTGFGSADFGGGPMNSINDFAAFLVKLDGSGNHLWSKSFGANSGNVLGGQSIAMAPNGDVVLSGNFSGSITFGANTFTTSAGTDADIFFARFSTTGTALWSRQVKGLNFYTDNGNSVAVDSNGNMLFSGQVFGAADFGAGLVSSPTYASIFTAKYSPTGTCLWAKSFGGNQAANGVAVDASNNVLTTGFWQGTIDFGGGPMTASPTDAFLVKLAP